MSFLAPHAVVVPPSSHAGSMQTVRPRSQPTSIVDSEDTPLCDLLVSVGGKEPCVVDCWTITAMEIPEHATDEMAASFTLIQGRYWAVGRLNGNLVYRQEPVADGDAANASELFLW